MIPRTTSTSEMAAADSDTDYEQFLVDHRAVLSHFNVPSKLWRRVHHKLSQQIFDAGSVFMFVHENDNVNCVSSTSEYNHQSTSKLVCVVAAEQGLLADEDVFLIDHAWSFANFQQARAQLESSDLLVERMTALMQIDLNDKSDPSLALDKSPIDLIMEQLHLFGFQYELIQSELAGTPSLETSTHAVSKMSRFYYVLDELGSRFTASTTCNCTQIPIIYAGDDTAYTLCWPNKDISYGELATVASRMPLDDYAHCGYWDARYVIMEGDAMTDEWYFSFAEIQPFLCASDCPDMVLPPHFNPLNNDDYDFEISPVQRGYASAVRGSKSDTVLTTIPDLVINNGLVPRLKLDTTNISGRVDYVPTVLLTESILSSFRLPILRTTGTSILVTGCGNAEFSGDLAAAGYTAITSVDYSDVCITQMRRKYAHVEALRWCVCDVTRQTEFGNGDFEVIIDKGCFDAIVSQNNVEDGLLCLREMHRLCAHNGRFVLFSLGKPQQRVRYLVQEGLFTIVNYHWHEASNSMSEHGLTRVLQSRIHIYVCKPVHHQAFTEK